MLGCCLLSFHFLWVIHPIRPVVSVILNTLPDKQHIHCSLVVQWLIDRRKQWDGHLKWNHQIIKLCNITFQNISPLSYHMWDARECLRQVVCVSCYAAMLNNKFHICILPNVLLIEAILRFPIVRFPLIPTRFFVPFRHAGRVCPVWVCGENRKAFVPDALPKCELRM